MTNEKQKYHIVGTVPKFNLNMVERGNIDTPNTQIYDSSRHWHFNIKVAGLN